MPNYEMRMGSNSQDSDTAFKEKDQAAIKSGPGYTRDGRPSKYPRSSGRFFYNKTNTPAPTPATTTKKADFGKIKQDFLSPAPPSKPKTVKPKASSPATASPKSKPVSTATPKPYVKKDGKATGKIKNYAIGSDARRKEYDARGWAYDDTIKGYNKDASKKQQRTQLKSPVSTVKPITSADIKPQISASSTSIPTIKPQGKSSKIRAKGQVALDQGNVKKAQRLRKRYDMIQGREAKKAQRQQKRQNRKTSLQFPSTFGYDPSKYTVVSSTSNTVGGAMTESAFKGYGQGLTSTRDTKLFKITKGPNKGNYKYYRIFKNKK